QSARRFEHVGAFVVSRIRIVARREVKELVPMAVAPATVLPDRGMLRMRRRERHTVLEQPEVRHAARVGGGRGAEGTEINYVGIPGFGAKCRGLERADAPGSVGEPWRGQQPEADQYTEPAPHHYRPSSSWILPGRSVAAYLADRTKQGQVALPRMDRKGRQKKRS